METTLGGTVRALEVVCHAGVAGSSPVAPVTLFPWKEDAVLPQSVHARDLGLKVNWV